MPSVDREELSKYIEHAIEHEDNPQSFRYQMEAQIQKYLQAQQHHLKVAHTQRRAAQLVQQDLQRRETLAAALQQKLKKTKDRKAKQLQEYAQGLANLRKQKEQMMREKVKASRKRQLQQSLDKIKSIQQRQEDRYRQSLVRSSTQKGLGNKSRIGLRNQAESLEREALVAKLERKGTFSMPSRAMSQLYFQKAKQIIRSHEEEDRKKAQKLVKSLDKIERAREKKKQLMNENSQRISRVEKHNFQLNRHRYQQIESKRREHIQSLMLEHAHQVQRSGSRVKQGLPKGGSSRLTEWEDGSGIEEVKQSKKGSYRGRIRKCIEEFLKGNGNK